MQLHGIRANRLLSFWLCYGRSLDFYSTDLKWSVLMLKYNLESLFVTSQVCSGVKIRSGKFVRHFQRITEIVAPMSSDKKNYGFGGRVIDSGATDHMTGSGTVKPTSSITLSFVLGLPKLAFNLMYVSKLTRDLNCYISFSPDHCLFRDLKTNKVIGTLSIRTSFLPMLKKLCPQFQNIPSLDFKTQFNTSVRILRSDNAK
ncbi:hypothetical protein KY284_020837 [Solanum tuberosum]|nr:hypothetical protein KY284_020837 [Solanum tuberosum]